MRRRFERSILAAAFLVTVSSGCGGATQSGTTEPPSNTAGGEDAAYVDPEGEGGVEPAFQFVSGDQEVIAEFDDEWESLAARFSEAVPQAAAVDCDAGSGYADAICDLASRICEIAERHPESPSVQERCASGQTGCESAREDMGQHCG